MTSESSVPSADERDAWPYARINFGVLVGDVTCFLIGISFLDTATALPAVIERLGGGPLLLGLMLALRQGAYYLPPLFVAHRLRGRKQYKGFLLRVSLAGRVWLFLATFCIWRFGLSMPALALGVLAAAYALSWAGDGAGGVPWTTIIGRTVPPNRRGALFATTQVLSAIGRMAVGIAVLYLLGSGTVPFPNNAALLALCCSVFLLFSWFFLTALREPKNAEAPDALPDTGENDTFAGYLKALPARLRERPEFARLALSQVLSTAGPASAPFIVAWAESHVDAEPLLAHLPGFLQHLLALLRTGGLPGLLLIAQTIGLISLAPLWGWLTDRRSPKTALRAVCAVGLMTPLCALLAGYAHRPGLTLALFLLAYFCLGAVQEVWVTYTNFLLEIVPPTEQPTFIALMSTASAPALVLPILAGLLAQQAGPPAAFVLALVLLLAGLWNTAHLPETRNNSRRLPAKADLEETG